jgi:hypothetical protein
LFRFKLLLAVFFSKQDLYVYVSESEKFKDFSNQEALIWSEKGLIYGDWSSGSAGDGIRVHNVDVKTTEVSVCIIQ